VFISAIAFRVRRDKEREFLDSTHDLLERARWMQGCFGCHVWRAIHPPQEITVMLDWADRASLGRFLRSAEYRILLGMRVLAEDVPEVTVDEVTTRTRLLTSEAPLVRGRRPGAS
jgi:quinol monooxygenase YgiN